MGYYVFPSISALTMQTEIPGLFPKPMPSGDEP
jgi:hypothetical protein